MVKSQFECVNYGKGYSAVYGDCAVYKETKKVKTVSVTKHVSLTEVKFIVSAKRSYAGAVTGDPEISVVVPQAQPFPVMPVGLAGVPPFFLVWRFPLLYLFLPM